MRDLAEAAQIHRNTVTNIETGRYAGDAATLTAIVGALKRAGVEFIDENGGGPVSGCESAHKENDLHARRPTAPQKLCENAV
jgi:transcriptional regulator with XRE-family HTH domain